MAAYPRIVCSVIPELVPEVHLPLWIAYWRRLATALSISASPPIADMIVEVLYHTADVQRRRTLHAFVVMPNHVHILVSPHIPLPHLTKALKGYSAKQANQMLSLTGRPFWQEESYDHLVRDPAEGDRIRSYIEQNPVRAGLVREAGEYRWSSAGWPTRKSAADQKVRPT